MPTKKRRLQLSLDEDLDVVFMRLSKLMERPQASIVMDLLRESLPVLQQTADALELAKSGKLDLNGFVGIVQQSIADAQAIESEMLEKQKDQ